MLAINLARKIEKGIADGETQRAERVVVLLAEEAGLQHERSGEENGQPEQAGAEVARLFGGGIEGEAEEHDDHQDEDDRGGEKFAGAEFGAKFLAEQDRRVGEEAHVRRLQR